MDYFQYLIIKLQFKSAIESIFKLIYTVYKIFYLFHFGGIITISKKKEAQIYLSISFLIIDFILFSILI